MADLKEHLSDQIDQYTEMQWAARCNKKTNAALVATFIVCGIFILGLLLMIQHLDSYYKYEIDRIEGMSYYIVNGQVKSYAIDVGERILPEVEPDAYYKQELIYKTLEQGKNDHNFYLGFLISLVVILVGATAFTQLYYRSIIYGYDGRAIYIFQKWLGKKKLKKHLTVGIESIVAKKKELRISEQGKDYHIYVSQPIEIRQMIESGQVLIEGQKG